MTKKAAAVVTSRRKAIPKATTPKVPVVAMSLEDFVGAVALKTKDLIMDATSTKKEPETVKMRAEYENGCAMGIAPGPAGALYDRITVLHEKLRDLAAYGQNITSRVSQVSQPPKPDQPAVEFSVDDRLTQSMLLISDLFSNFDSISNRILG